MSRLELRHIEVAKLIDANEHIDTVEERADSGHWTSPFLRGGEVQFDHAPHVVVIVHGDDVVRLPGRSSKRVLCISLYTFVLNRFPCSIIIGMLLRTHDFNSSQFATRHPAEGVGFLSLALGGDGGGLGSALEGE